MSKQSKRTARNSQSSIAKTKQLMQKETRERVERLVTNARQNGLMARRLAAASNVPENVPPALMKQFRAALKTATMIRRPAVSRATEC
jgi:ribosomal protein L17